MAAITICSDFRAPKNKVWHCSHCFPTYFPWSDGTRCPWSSLSECWALSQLFHSPLSLSSRGSVVLHFLQKGWCHPAYMRLLIFLPAILISQFEKGVFQDCILSPCLFNLYAEYIIRNTGLDEAQAGIKISSKGNGKIKSFWAWVKWVDFH